MYRRGDVAETVLGGVVAAHIIFSTRDHAAAIAKAENLRGLHLGGRDPPGVLGQHPKDAHLAQRCLRPVWPADATVALDSRTEPLSMLGQFAI
jgi:hypothetical protein